MGGLRRCVILTALPLEFQAVRAHLVEVDDDVVYKGTVYSRGRFIGGTNHWEVLVAEVGAGNSAVSFEAERAFAFVDPEIAIFVGVAGGIKDVASGDVVAATKVYGYESGVANEAFRPRPDAGASSYQLVQRAKAVNRQSAWLSRIIGEMPKNSPKAFVGPIAAGEKVVRSKRAPLYAFLRENYGDALAVEMEGRGFLAATHASTVQALIVRGISDLIDDKTAADAGGGQERAASHAAAFAFEVLAMLRLATDVSASERTDPTPAKVSPEQGPIGRFKAIRSVLQDGYSRRADGPSTSFLEHGARSVGIAYLRKLDSSEHLAWIMERQLHYAPIKRELRAPDFLAFYAPRSKHGAGALTHVARVIAQERVKRSEVSTPWPATHALDEECVLYRLAQVEALERPIENHSGRFKLTETSAAALALAADTRELHARDPRAWWLLGQLRVRQESPRFHSGTMSGSSGVELEDGSVAQLNDDQTVTIHSAGDMKYTVSLEEFFAP